MNANDPAVAVVVPVRNEAGNIAPLVAEIAAALDGQWPFEVVYVDDGSSDGTAAELARTEGAAFLVAQRAPQEFLRPVGGNPQRRQSRRARR